MMACSRWLIRQRLDDNYQLIKTVFEAAYADERPAIIALLRDPPPHQKLRRGQRPAPADLNMGREVTLGERRSLARKRDRRVLERLLVAPDKMVVEQLLQNPGVLEQDVIQIASARPNQPDILLEIALNRRWFLRAQVRFTLAMNPYANTGLALKLLPTLDIHKLRQLKNATHIHPVLVDTAELLVELREQRTAPWHH